ncbi:MAG: helix-turn-helix domain-containing protein [Ruminococcus sp.]|nr:helix-turn-helix domain-containing protein [Ruminococcus sp.]
MTDFLKNVILLLEQNGITKNKMLVDLQLGKNSMVNWENRNTIPNGKTLNKIAEYFNVSTDYLLGKAEKSKPADNMFWKIFYDLCESVGKKPNPVASEIGISSATVTKWKNGTPPGSKSLAKIAEYFNVSTDYLLGKADKPADELNDDEKELLDLYRQLPAEQHEFIKNAIRGQLTAIDEQAIEKKKKA